MKFTVAVAALAAGAQAAYPAVSNVTYTTEVVSVYTTFCPAATQITYGSKTYTVTEATTLTISDCPCTVSKPVLTTSSVKCSTCSSAATSAATSAASVPVYPTGNNGTAAVTPKPTGGSIPTTVKTSAVASTSAAGSSSAPSSVPTGAAGKVAALSGAGLAAIVGVAAFL